jgi:hypothetical protein
MLDEIVLTKTGMGALSYIALPSLKLSMSLILMSNPVGLALEGFRLVATRKRTSEWLNVLVDMLSPIRRFVELFDFET